QALLALCNPPGDAVGVLAGDVPTALVLGTPAEPEEPAVSHLLLADAVLVQDEPVHEPLLLGAEAHRCHRCLVPAHVPQQHLLHRQLVDPPEVRQVAHVQSVVATEGVRPDATLRHEPDEHVHLSVLPQQALVVQLHVRDCPDPHSPRLPLRVSVTWMGTVCMVTQYMASTSGSSMSQSAMTVEPSRRMSSRFSSGRPPHMSQRYRMNMRSSRSGWSLST